MLTPDEIAMLRKLVARYPIGYWNQDLKWADRRFKAQCIALVDKIEEEYGAEPQAGPMDGTV